MFQEKLYVQYGCGDCAPDGWLNFDASPTLRIQKTPIIGKLLRRKLNLIFPKFVMYGDITKGLPIKENSCDGIFASHVLEHLPLNDFHTALDNTYRMLKKGGIFRCIIPDLQYYASEYLKILTNNSLTQIELSDANSWFMRATYLGFENRLRTIKDIIIDLLGNSHHRWMWDEYSLSKQLLAHGFIDIEPFEYNNSQEPMFLLVEEQDRFKNAVCLQCRK